MHRRGVLVATLALLVASSAAAAPREATMQDAVASGFCGTVIVADDGSIVLDKAYGLADPQTPNRTSTAFRIGGLSRLFVATAVVMLAEGGKLSLDNTVEQLVPGTGPETLRSLLARPGDDTTTLLARALGAVSRGDVAGRLDATQFGPLWMTATEVDDGKPSHRPATDPRNTRPPNGWAVVTTTRDLLRWTNAFLGNRLVSADGRRFLIGDPSAGGWDAFSPSAALNVRGSTIVIVLSNGGMLAPDALAARLAQP